MPDEEESSSDSDNFSGLVGFGGELVSDCESSESVSVPMCKLGRKLVVIKNLALMVVFACFLDK